MASTLRMPFFLGFVFVAELLVFTYIKFSALPSQTAPDTGHPGALGSFLTTSTSTSTSSSSSSSASASASASTASSSTAYTPPRLPGPLTVACLSSQRTLSTTAFNLVRVLMERVDPNAISGWDNDVVGSKPDERLRDVLPNAHGKVSVVYKSHNGRVEQHQHADFFVVTYRDPYAVMCSMGHMFVPAIFHDAGKAAAKCHRMAANEAGIRYWATTEGPQALHINSDALKSMDGMVQIVQVLMKKWGVQGGTLDAREVAAEVLELVSPEKGIFAVAHPRTELHPHHITSSTTTQQDCEALQKVIEADEVCRAWHEGYGAMFPEGSPMWFDEASSRAAAIKQGATRPPPPSNKKKQKQQKYDKPGGHKKASPRATTTTTTSSSSQAADDGEDKYFFCLPNGGFNDVCVELWKCVQFALNTKRVLVLGFENYNPVRPPWDPYFALANVPGLRTMSPYEAATALNARGRRVTVFPKRLEKNLDPLLGPRPRQGSAPEGLAPLQPFPFEFHNLKRLKFRFENLYTQDVVVFHRQGNIGSGMDSLKHMLFSSEIRHTFLARWATLRKPYLALHLRRTDKSCSGQVFKNILKKVHRLGKDGVAAGGPVYVASDHPEVPADFQRELEEVQGRDVVSFTYHPPLHEPRVAIKENAALQKKKENERHSLGLEGLHLHDDLSPEEKHKTNLDAFVDLLLLASAEALVTSCGGYSRLAKDLHADKPTILSLLGVADGDDQDFDTTLTRLAREDEVGEAIER